ncbi:MAG TPA: hypothetical protein VGL45_10020 [Bradyrhizobium sp.]
MRSGIAVMPPEISAQQACTGIALEADSGVTSWPDQEGIANIAAN